MKTIRVLVFGATGMGKTSLCNTLTGRSRPTDNGAKGMTAKSHVYAPFRSGDHRIELIDTVGLHESCHGTVSAEQAVLDLVALLEKARDGFSLLVHVTRASRITKEHDDDYAFFVEKMTERRIPVILVATGCENEQPMSAWVTRNQHAFERFSYKELIPSCFASGGPMEKHYEPLRIESQHTVCEAILAHALDAPAKLYGPGTGQSFSHTLFRVWNEFVVLFGLPEKYRREVNESVYGLMKRLGVPKAIADAAIKNIPDLLGELASKAPVPGAGKLMRTLATFILKKIIQTPK